MLDRVIANRDTVQELGVISSYLDSFAADLAACGYASTTVQSQLKLLGHFNEWLIRRRCDIHQLNDSLVDTFVRSRKRGERLHRGNATTLHQFLGSSAESVGNFRLR
jgi:site-specific recombinase XerD